MLKKIKKNLILLLIFLLQFILTSCFDKVEIENRSFVVSVAVDKEKDKFKVSLSIPNKETFTGKGEESKVIKSSTKDSVFSALNEIDSNSSQNLYFGQTKLLVLGKDILEDEKSIKETLDFFERNTKISRKIIVLATDLKAEEIIKAKIEEKYLVGIFVADYFKDYNNKGGTVFKEDLESVVENLALTKDCVIPKITLEDEKINLGGAAIIKDYKLKSFLTDEEVKYYLFIKEKISDSEITTEFHGSKVPLKINANKTKFNVIEKENKLFMNMNVKIKGTLEEFKIDDSSVTENINVLEKQYEEELKKEILNIYKKMVSEYKIDAFLFQDYLRKFNYDLYVKHKQSIENDISFINLVTDINVEIESTGSVK